MNMWRSALWSLCLVFVPTELGGKKNLKPCVLPCNHHFGCPQLPLTKNAHITHCWCSLCSTQHVLCSLLGSAQLSVREGKTLNTQELDAQWQLAAGFKVYSNKRHDLCRLSFLVLWFMPLSATVTSRRITPRLVEVELNDFDKGWTHETHYTIIYVCEKYYTQKHEKPGHYVYDMNSVQ